MKKFFKVALSVLFVISLYVFWGIILTEKDQTYSFVQDTLRINRPCSRSLKFSIGSIGPEFGVSEEELISLSIQAANSWNSAIGKEVLRYDPNGEFRINLIFDERQNATLEAQKLQDDLKNLEVSHESLSEKYKTLNSTYKKEIDDYSEKLKDYRDDLEKYNDEVEYWNDEGGAPSDEYEKLKKEKEKLRKILKKIEAQRKEINKLVEDGSNIALQENQMVQNYNSDLNTYKEEFGDTHEFEKGIFNGEAINIYQFQRMSDLELTLMHELGHYLGLSHVENPESVMHYLIGDQNLNNPSLTKEDVDEMKRVCKIN